MEDLLGIAVRVTITYLYLLAMLRVTGKRTIGQLSLPDAAAAFIIGDMFDDLIWAEIPVARGLTGIAVVMLVHLLVVVGSYRFGGVGWLAEGRSTLMIRAGSLVPEGLRREHIREEEVEGELREKGLDRMEEVKEAFQEAGAHMSVVKKDEYRTAQKRDLPKLEALLP